LHINFISKVKNSIFAKNIITLITGTALGQTIIVISSPILTRLYSPEDFGILALYISIVSILSVVINLKYESAIVLPKDDHKAQDLFFLSIGIGFGLSVVLFLITVIFNQQLTELTGYPEFSFYLYLMPLSTFFYGSFQALSSYMTRQQQFNQLALSNTLKGAGTAGTQISWGLVLQAGAFGLILGQIAGNGFASLYLIQSSFREIISRITPKIRENFKVVLVEYKLFPLFTSSTTLINAISQNIPALLLALLFSPAVAGFYAIAARIMLVPIGLISNSVRQVYYQRASQSFNQGHSIYPLFKKMTGNLALVGILPAFIMIIFGENIFSFVLGNSWGEAGIYASIITLWQYFVFINRPSAASLLILKLNHIQLIMDSISLILRLGALLAGTLIFKNIYITLGLFTLVGIMFNLSLIGYVYIKLRREHLKK